MRVLKKLLKKNDKIIFRVNKDIYPEKVIEKVFGNGKKEGKYIIFETKLDEERIYEKFDRLLEGIV